MRSLNGARAMGISWEIFRRELLVAGRGRPRSYALPWTVVAVSITVWFLTNYFDLDMPIASNQQIAALLFVGLGTFSQWGALAAIIQGVASHGIAEERARGSLDLLLLAESKSFRVVRAKYLAALVQCVAYVAAFFPLQMIGSRLWPAFSPYILDHVMYTMAIAVVAPAVALAVSAWTRNVALAGGIAFAGSALWALLFMVGWNMARYGAFYRRGYEIVDIVSPAQGAREWGVMFLCVVLCVVVLLGVACRGVGRTLPAGNEGARRGVTVGRMEPSLLGLVRTAAWGRLSWKRNVALAMMGLAMGAIPVLGWLLVPCGLAAGVTQGISRMRQSGLWDEVMIAPEGDEDLAGVIYHAAARSSRPFTWGGILGATCVTFYFYPIYFVLLPFAALFILTGTSIGLSGSVESVSPKDQERSAVGMVMSLYIIHGVFIPTLGFWLIMVVLKIPVQTPGDMWVMLWVLPWFVFITTRARRRGWRKFVERYRVLTPEELV